MRSVRVLGAFARNLCADAVVNLAHTTGVIAGVRGRFPSSSTCSGFPGVIDCVLCTVYCVLCTGNLTGTILRNTLGVRLPVTVSSIGPLPEGRDKSDKKKWEMRTLRTKWPHSKPRRSCGIGWRTVPVTEGSKKARETQESERDEASDPPVCE